VIKAATKAQVEHVYYTSGLDAFPGLDSAWHQAVNRGNAEALFPRLAVA
jgi:hypothetical protein